MKVLGMVVFWLFLLTVTYLVITNVFRGMGRRLEVSSRLSSESEKMIASTLWPIILLHVLVAFAGYLILIAVSKVSEWAAGDVWASRGKER